VESFEKYGFNIVHKKKGTVEKSFAPSSSVSIGPLR